MIQSTDADDGFEKYAAYLAYGTNAPRYLICAALNEAYRAGIERAAKWHDECAATDVRDEHWRNVHLFYANALRAITSPATAPAPAAEPE